MTDYVTGADLASYLERDQSAALDNIASRTNLLIDEEWVNPRTPVPQWIVNLAWDVAIRAGANPRGHTSETKSFDDITRTERFDPNKPTGVYLTDDEKAKLNGDTGETNAVPPTGPKSIRMVVPGWSCRTGYPPCY